MVLAVLPGRGRAGGRGGGVARHLRDARGRATAECDVAATPGATCMPALPLLCPAPSIGVAGAQSLNSDVYNLALWCLTAASRSARRFSVRRSRLCCMPSAITWKGCWAKPQRRQATLRGVRGIRRVAV